MKRTLQRRTINFADCDPAHLVHYPRYFEWFDRGTEMLLRSVGIGWESLLGKGDWNGVPPVDAAATFRRPSRFGDTVEIESWVEEWRCKIFLVCHHITNQGELAVEGRELPAWVVTEKDRPAGVRAEPVPAEIVGRFQS